MFKFLKTWVNNRMISYEKRKATRNDQPWIKVLSIDLSDVNKPTSGSMILDWNEPFIKMLHANGYVAHSEHQLVDMWLQDLCRGILNDNQQE